MVLFSVHRLVDAMAVWSEDRKGLRPMPYRPTRASSLDCFGPLPGLPDGPASPGPWSAPSPRPRSPADRMSLLWTSARGDSRGTVLLVPPWRISRRDLVEGYVSLLVRAGLDVWLLTPPHHLERAAPGTQSGDQFVTLDLACFRQALEQFVLEIRTCAALAARRGGELGLVGLSLGALAGALALTAEPSFDFAALVAPPVDLALVMTETGIGRRYRRLAARAGSPMPDRRSLQALLRCADPRHRRPLASRLLIAAGRDDAIAPAPPAIDLARVWNIDPLVYPRGHITLLFLCRSLRRDLERFVANGATRRAPPLAGQEYDFEAPLVTSDESIREFYSEAFW